MKFLMRIVTTDIFFIGTTLFFSANAALAQDAADVSPNVYKTLWENDQVRVLEMKLKPGDSDKMHSHPSEVVQFVNAGKVKVTLPNGGSAEKEVKAGEVMPHEGWIHTVENIGTTEIYAIIVEVKPPKKNN